jgi:DNA-binding CsgD family transcriptional regulator
LFVTRKSVDYHLHDVYQKLATTRDGLAGIVAAAGKD